MKIPHLQPGKPPLDSACAAELHIWDRPPSEWDGESIDGLFESPGQAQHQGVFRVLFDDFEVGDRPQTVVSMSLRMVEPTPTEELASIPLSRLLRAAEALVIAQKRNSIEDWPASVQASAVATGEAIEVSRRPLGRPSRGYEFYRRIGKRYEDLCAEGDPRPVTTIATEECVNRNTAAAWVNRCRKKGLLPPARKGMAG